MFYPKKGMTDLLNLTTNTTLSVLSLFCYCVALLSSGRKPVLMLGEFWEVRRSVSLIQGTFGEIAQRIVASSCGASVCVTTLCHLDE